MVCVKAQALSLSIVYLILSNFVKHRLHVWSQLVVVVVSYRLSVLWSDAALTYNLQLT